MKHINKPAVYAFVVQAGHMESYRSVEKVLVAVVLVDVLQIVKKVKMC